MSRFRTARSFPGTTAPDELPADEIVVAVRGGNVDAYRFLVQRYQNEILKIVNAMLIDFSGREDVVQQVFVRAYQRLHQYELGRDFGLWLQAIARNLVREELRRRYRYLGRLEAYSDNLLAQLDGEAAALPGALEETERRNGALRECIESLDETAAGVVRMHYLERHSTEEIGGRLGRSGGAIRTLLYRSRAALRRCLEAKGVAP